MATASSLTQNTITWTFDAAYEYGQYANGDYWVVAQGGTPIVTISAISHTNAADKIANQVNSNINPRWSSGAVPHGYDARIARYAAGSNSQPPFHLHPGESVVSVTSWTALHGDEGSYLADAAVLTCVDEIQPAGTFRPPYCRPTREADSSADTLRYNISQINWSRIPSVAKPVSTPAIANTLALVAKVWIDNLEGYSTNSQAHPTNNMRDYGRDIAQNISEVACQLMLNYIQAEKQALLYAFLQLGIDIYGQLLDGARWYADGGHGSGRHFPLTFAGWILGVAGIISEPITYVHAGDGQTIYRYGEDGQTYYYNDADLPDWVNALTSAIVGGPGANIYACKGAKGWVGIRAGGSGDSALFRIVDYTSAGTVFLGGEYTDVDNWSTLTSGDHEYRVRVYQGCCTSIAWIGYALAGKMLGSSFQTAYGHQAFFDYCDRWMTEDDSAAAAAFNAIFGAGAWGNTQGSSTVDFIDDMYSTYKDWITEGSRLVMVIL